MKPPPIQLSTKTDSRTRLIALGFFVIVSIGIFLRFYQYLMGRSLWEDETHLALNFMKHNFAELTRPLDYIQAGPLLFLFGVKAFAVVFGYSEMALRALPFICSILTLPLIYYIILNLSGSKLAALSGFFMFAVNASVIYFSSELKPYALDVSVYLFLIYLTVSKNAFIEQHRNKLLALSGSIAILFSSITFIVLFSIACGFILTWVRDRKIKKEELMVLVPWAVVFIINYFLFIHNHPATEAQRTNYAFAFFPTDILSCEFLTFLNKTIEGTFFVMLNISQRYYFPWVLLGLFIIALRHIYKLRQYSVFLYVCLPVLFHAGLSVLKIYPFWYRLILYLTPCFIYLISVGLVQLVAFIKNKSHVSLAIIPAFGIYYFLTSDAVKQFPLWFREIKPALAYVNGMPSEMHLYMSEPAHAYEYYYKRGEARIPVYREIPWSLNDGELQELVDEEKSPYMIFYIPDKFTNVIEDLKKKGSLVHSFMYKNYGVALIKPLVRDHTTLKLNYTYFDAERTFHVDNSIAIWNGEIQSKEFRLTPGKYRVTVISRGTPVGGVYPVNSIFVNGQKLGTFTAGNSFEKDTFSCIINEELDSRLKITLDNDEQTNNEDRNTFLRAIVISPEKEEAPSIK